MNISKFTQKSLQAVQNLEKTAYDFGNQEIEQEHLLYNLLHQEDSLILKMIEKMEINKEHFLNNVENALNARVKVSGNPCTEDQITDTKCHLYRGTAIVILKSKEAGETKITVKADGVAAGSCVVEAK